MADRLKFAERAAAAAKDVAARAHEAVMYPEGNLANLDVITFVMMLRTYADGIEREFLPSELHQFDREAT